MGCLSPYPLQINYLCHCSYGYYFCNQFVASKLVTVDVTAVFVSDQHGIQRQRQDFDKKFAFEGVHSKEVDGPLS